MSASVLNEVISYTMGIPNPPSVVPGFMSDFTDQMSFTERSMNFVGSVMFIPYFLRLANTQTAVFRQVVGADFPSLIELARDKTELVFVNSVELLDFPRPTLHKVVYIGGIGMNTQEHRRLNAVRSHTRHLLVHYVFVCSIGHR
jgi:hypothetical protein